MRQTHAVKKSEMHTHLGSCPMCGVPLDSEYFDESGVTETDQEEVLTPGQEVVLASFELPPQYCGVLEYFSQFTDVHAREPANRFATPGHAVDVSRSTTDPSIPISR